jgi:nitrite reductase/ring-hydroxylating ferredoxin subunit/uncharacterized membrane protein
MGIEGRQPKRGGRPEPAEPWLDRTIRRQNWMEGVADWVQAVVGSFYGFLGRPGRLLKDLLHGTKILGHPLHPALTDVPLGAWTVGVVADLLAVITGRIPPIAGDLGLAVGVAGALAAAASGYTDFHETYGHERRTALTHGLVMTSVVVIDLVSLGLRLGPAGLRPVAIALALGAYLLALAGAFVGGHLTFGLGTMVNRNAFLEGPTDYVSLGSSTDFPEGQLRRVEAGSMPVLAVRMEGTVCAISAVCSHAGGPLDEGALEGDIVTCPWHGSRFNVCSGRVVGGPATFDQPPFDVREQDGRIDVRLAHPLH